MESKLKKILTSKPFLFLLLLAVIWLALVLVQTFYRRYQLENEISNLKQEIDKIDKKDKNLNNLLNYFNSQSFLEKEAKDKLNMKKEGENVVIIPEMAGSAQSSSEEQLALDQKAKTAESPENSSNFIKWWQYFFVK